MRLGFKWAADLAAANRGIVDDSPAPALQATAIAAANCVQGFAGQFPCRNVDFLAQISLNQFASQPASAANVWGFVDLNDNREYAIIGLSNGTAVVDVTDPANPRQVVHDSRQYLALARGQDLSGVRRRRNRFRAYAYITTEAPNSGLQVIDLSGLPNYGDARHHADRTPARSTRLYVSNIDYATNVALPGAEAFLLPRGQQRRGGAWRAYSLANPAQPQLITTAPAGTQYVHDATSLLITDERTAQCASGTTLARSTSISTRTRSISGTSRRRTRRYAVVHDLFGRELHAFRLADRRPAPHLRAR